MMQNISLSAQGTCGKNVPKYQKWLWGHRLVKTFFNIQVYQSGEYLSQKVEDVSLVFAI